jgi:sporulation related protein
MSNYDRGVYEPSDEVRVFDGSEEEDDVEGSRLPLLIVLALLVLAMFAGVVWLAYTQGVARGRGETPVLTAAAGPERVAPPGGGAGAQVPYQGFKIYEQPAPPDDEAADNTPKPPAPKPAPVAEAPPPKPAPTPVAPAPAPTAMTAAPPKPVVAPPPAAAKPAAPAPKSVASLIQQSNTAPPPAKPVPAPKPVTPPPAMKQALVPPPGPATGAPRQLGLATAPPPPVAKPIAAVPAPGPAAAAGGYVLQIGAYKSQADAEAAWKAYKGRHAALLTGYSENIQQVELGEKGTWYRLRVAGLGDREVALALCDRLKADGGACILSH